MIFKNNTLIRLALKICQKMSFKKMQVIKYVFLLLKNTSYIVL